MSPHSRKLKKRLKRIRNKRFRAGKKALLHKENNSSNKLEEYIETYWNDNQYK